MKKKKQIKELLKVLKLCTEWMENSRTCGDFGNWEWEEASAFVKAHQVLNEIERIKHWR